MSSGEKAENPIGSPSTNNSNGEQKELERKRVSIVLDKKEENSESKRFKDLAITENPAQQPENSIIPMLQKCIS